MNESAPVIKSTIKPMVCNGDIIPLEEYITPLYRAPAKKSTMVRVIGFTDAVGNYIPCATILKALHVRLAEYEKAKIVSNRDIEGWYDIELDKAISIKTQWLEMLYKIPGDAHTSSRPVATVDYVKITLTTIEKNYNKVKDEVSKLRQIVARKYGIPIYIINVYVDIVNEKGETLQSFIL